MANVLVCVKRVPAIAGKVSLTADEQAVDARHVGYMLSAHEECAVELAIQVAEESGGDVTVLTLGTDDSVEQLRGALALGAQHAVLIEADPAGYGPRDVAAAIAAAIGEREASGTQYDLILMGNDASDTGDFQVGIRVAYALGRPVLAGISTLRVAGDQVVAQGDGPEGQEVFEVPLPAVVTILEGGVSPRYPSIIGRMKAKKVQVATLAAAPAQYGPGRVRLTLPPEQPSQVEVLGEGAAAAPALVDLLEKIGVVR